MTTDDLYQIMSYACAKNQSQGYLSEDDFNRVINIGVRSQITFLLGTFQQYMPGRPVARVEFGQNSVIRQRLAPAIYGYILNTDTNGRSPYPGDYLQTDSMYSIYGNKRIRNAQQHSLDSYVNSSIDPVATNPIYLIEDNNFQFYPITISQAKLNYLRNPPDIVWASTLDGNNRPVYDPIRSVQPIFDDLFMFEAICRALMLVGVNLQLSVVMQYASSIKNEGQ